MKKYIIPAAVVLFMVLAAALQVTYHLYKEEKAERMRQEKNVYTLNEGFTTYKNLVRDSLHAARVARLQYTTAEAKLYARERLLLAKDMGMDAKRINAITTVATVTENTVAGNQWKPVLINQVPPAGGSFGVLPTDADAQHGTPTNAANADADAQHGTPTNAANAGASEQTAKPSQPPAVPDTCLQYKDQWFTAQLCLKDTSLTVHSRDSLSGYGVRMPYRVRILGITLWKYGTKNVELHMVNHNPKSKITYLQYLELKNK